MSIIPKSKPQAKAQEITKRIPKDIAEKYAVVLVGVRGYYLDSMGTVGKNDRGIYDDAIFLVTPDTFASFNANTDPSAFKTGVSVLKKAFTFTARVSTRSTPQTAMQLFDQQRKTKDCQLRETVKAIVLATL